MNCPKCNLDVGTCEESKKESCDYLGDSKIEIDRADLWPLLLSTVRYSMGRMSYMPSYCQEMVQKYAHLLPAESLAQIYHEVEKELTSYEAASRTMGADFDHNGWKKFIEKGRKKKEEK